MWSDCVGAYRYVGSNVEWWYRQWSEVQGELGCSGSQVAKSGGGG